LVLTQYDASGFKHGDAIFYDMMQVVAWKWIKNQTHILDKKSFFYLWFTFSIVYLVSLTSKISVSLPLMVTYPAITCHNPSYQKLLSSAFLATWLACSITVRRPAVRSVSTCVRERPRAFGNTLDWMHRSPQTLAHSCENTSEQRCLWTSMANRSFI